MLEVFGWTGSILLAVCGVPEAIKSFVSKGCSLSWAFLILWLMGELFVLIPVAIEIKKPWLILNYGLNIVCILVMINYKLRGNSYGK